jgi:hypothetical protein
MEGMSGMNTPLIRILLISIALIVWMVLLQPNSIEHSDAPKKYQAIYGS